MDDRSGGMKSWVSPALVVAVCSISFAAIFFRKAAPTHPLTCAGLRLAVAALILSPMTIRAAIDGRLRGKLLGYAAAAGIAYGVHFGAWVTSLTLTTVAASVTLVTTTPLILAAVGAVTGKDRPTQKLWFCLALAVAGLLAVGWKDLSLGWQALAGDGLAIVGAGAMAAYMLIGRKLGDAMQLWAFTGVATAVGAVALLGCAAIAGISLVPDSIESMAYIALAAILPQLVGHSLLTWSLRYAKPFVVGMAVLGEPVGATVLAWLWLGETITGLIAAGCALTLIAVTLSVAKSPSGAKGNLQQICTSNNLAD